MKTDPYLVLDVPRSASLDEARAAYRRLAEIYHPDRFAGARPEVRAEAEKQMKRLNRAWTEIRDASTRRPRASASSAENQTRSSDPDRPADLWDEDFGVRARHARTREQAQRRRTRAEREQQGDTRVR